MKTIEYIKNIKHVFSQNSDKEKGYAMSKYMRFNFEYHGINSPTRKELQKEFLKDNPLSEIENLEEVINKLWDLPQREYQYFAMEIMHKLTSNQDSSFIDFLEKLILKKSWWDSIDFISPTLLGELFKKYPGKIEYNIEKWMNSGNFWLQRSCILFQLKYKNETNFDLLKSLIYKLKDEKEFFIRKAIGWSLREYSKTNPDAVLNFIENTELSKLSRTEGLKHINKK
jgi:3-methyladenine DNA glycosylase AlkD